MKACLLFSLLTLFSPLLATDEVKKITPYLDEVMEDTKELIIEGFPGAYNPSIIDVEGGYLMAFRWHPNPSKLWISEIGILRLNRDLVPLGSAQVVRTRTPFDPTPSQAEDARLFRLRGKLYLIYNDNIEVTKTAPKDRRDLFIAELYETGSQFRIKKPLKLIHPTQYFLNNWEKNWVPFVKDEEFLVSYSIDPHEVLFPDCESGVSRPIAKTACLKPIWKWGPIRGGTPAIEEEDHYIGFFHSWIKVGSNYNYYMGAYTFEKEPPFRLTGISSKPIAPRSFYRNYVNRKKVIFPGGVIDEGDHFLIIFGVDDCKIFASRIAKNLVYETLTPLSNQQEFPCD